MTSNRFTTAQITSGLQAYHAACPGVPIIITEFGPVDSDPTSQLQLTQSAIAAFQADPLVIGILLWYPDSVYAIPENIGPGFFTNGQNFRPAFTWLINTISLPFPK